MPHRHHGERRSVPAAPPAREIGSQRIAKLLARAGQFWQHESYDHWVRDEDELERVVAYINANPVAAGLVARAEVWFWGSAHERYLMDRDRSGWLVLS